MFCMYLSLDHVLKHVKDHVHDQGLRQDGTAFVVAQLT